MVYSLFHQMYEVKLQASSYMYRAVDCEQWNYKTKKAVYVTSVCQNGKYTE